MLMTMPAIAWPSISEDRVRRENRKTNLLPGFYQPLKIRDAGTQDTTW